MTVTTPVPPATWHTLATGDALQELNVDGDAERTTHRLEREGPG